MTRSFLSLLSEAFQSGKPFSMITIVGDSGSSPRLPGARMLVFPDGSIQGTVGGGAMEHHLMGLARTALETGKSSLVQVDLSKDLGMLCGGTVTAFIEPLNIRPAVVVFGAGHVARALVPLLLSIDFQVTVVDDRGEWADPAAFPAQASVICRDLSSFAESLENLSNMYILIMTRDHALDYAVLRILVEKEVGYLGVMGSKSKRDEIMSRLRSDGVPQEVIDKVYMPIGLPIRTTTPQEISVSIAAHLLEVRNGTR